MVDASMAMTQVRITTEAAAAKDGILFVSVAPTGGESETAGDTAYAPMVAETIKLAALTTEPRVKVVLAKVCIEVHKQPTGTISVVYGQGRPIVKSLQRIVRCLARHSASKDSHHTTNPKSAATIAHEGPDGRGHDGEVPDGGYNRPTPV
jgi:hypothetical protein